MTNLSVPEISESAPAIGGERRSLAYTPVNRLEHMLAAIVGMEFLAVTGICFLTSVVYFRTMLTGWPPVSDYLGASALIALLVAVSALGFKQYSAIQERSRDRFMWSGLGAAALAFSLFLSVLFLFKIAEWYSRGTFFAQFFGVSIVMLAARASVHGHVRHAIQSGSVAARRAVLVGDADSNDEILSKLKQSGIRWTGILPFPHVHGNVVPGAEAFSKSIRTFVERCRALKPDEIIFLAAPADLSRIAVLADALSELPVAVHVVPTEVNGFWQSAKPADLGGMVSLQVLRPPLSTLEIAVKRAFDICAAGFGLTVLSPLMLIVSLAIKLDSAGPVIFRQNRHGYNNEVIPVLKFRTMSVAEDGETAATFAQAKANDARVTRLGHFLRRTNIDELPQLFNILRGHMSVVGPRPHPIALNSIFQERITPFSRRHNVKPGLTGWAQVNGFRGETDTVEKMRKRIEFDLYYIDNWSLIFDLKIIIMTVFSKGAYRNAC